MDIEFYLNRFRKIVDQLNPHSFDQKGLHVNVDEYLSSAVLKIQSPAWLNQSAKARPFKESVFFSIWINDESAKASKIMYNIHALKLRELTGYKIKSRDFAMAFREKFKAFENNWPNVRVDFGPLTLIEGWICLDDDNFENNVKQLILKFLEIEFIIGYLLTNNKK